MAASGNEGHTELFLAHGKVSPPFPLILSSIPILSLLNLESGQMLISRWGL